MTPKTQFQKMRDNRAKAAMLRMQRESRNYLYGHAIPGVQVTEHLARPLSAAEQWSGQSFSPAYRGDAGG